MIFHDFPHLFRYRFLHDLLMRFSIDIGSNLGLFVNILFFLLWLIVQWFWGDMFIDVDQKWIQKADNGFPFTVTSSFLFPRGPLLSSLGSLCYPVGSMLVALGTPLGPFNRFWVPLGFTFGCFRALVPHLVFMAWRNARSDLPHLP